MGLKEICKELIGGAKQAKRVTIKHGGTIHFVGTKTSAPATPEPRYICKNCGMVIETSHKHTLEECKEYFHPTDAPKNPDHRSIKKISEFPSTNQPKVRLPFYYNTSRTSKMEDES